MSATSARPSKGDRTRARLTEATAELLRRQGYHATGLAEIVATAGAPRGSLYFHFPGGKEELACAALTAAGTAWRQRLDVILDGAPDLGVAVERVCATLADELEASGFADGCPLATVALEAGAGAEPVRRTIAAHYDGWIADLAARLVDHGVVAAHAPPLARFALATLEGALLLARVGRTTLPVREAGATLRALLAMTTGAAPVSPARRGRSGRAAAPRTGRAGRR